MISRERNQFRVHLNVVGFAEDPDDISLIIGIAPDKVWRSGDQIDRTSRTHRSNGWRVGSGAALEDGLARHIQALLARIAPAKKRLRALNARREIAVIVYVHEQGAPELHFDADAVRACAELDASIDIDLYCLAEDRDDA